MKILSSVRVMLILDNPNQTMKNQNYDTGETLRSMIALTTVLVWIYFICIVGDSVSSRFETINGLLYQSKWYLYPNKLQKHLLFMMINAQKPVHLEGFSFIQCNCKAFTKVRPLTKKKGKRAI